MAKATKTYQELRSELDTILIELQQPDGDIEAAVKLYERGLACAKEMQQLLSKTENRIQQLSEIE